MSLTKLYVNGSTVAIKREYKLNQESDLLAPNLGPKSYQRCIGFVCCNWAKGQFGQEDYFTRLVKWVKQRRRQDNHLKFRW